MLQKLIIKNYALIEELNIQPDSKLNTITGETGAGKSIMLGAVGLLLGKRADTKVLYKDDSKCIVEGTFQIKSYQLKGFFDQEELDYDDECIIRREISSSGKSRAFINDSPVTLDILKTLGANLMDVHSQHQTLLLGEQDFQLHLVDAYTGAEELLQKYNTSYQAYKKNLKALKKYQEEHKKLQAEKDYNQFLFDELEKAELISNEQESLEEKVKLLENGEYIQQKLAEASAVLEQSEYSVVSSLHQAVESFRGIQSFDQKYKDLFERLQSTFIELQDIANTAEVENNKFEHDPLELVNVQERLSLIYQLQQKHHVDSIEALLAVKNDLSQKLLLVEDATSHIDQLKKEVDKSEKEVNQLGISLSEKRKNGFTPIEVELKSLLKDLGMEDASIKIRHEVKAPELNGIDNITILFSANKGIAPQVLKTVASGGEFSRLLFAFKYLMADKVAMPTIIFDEIDTGISGEIALKMVHMMQMMAENHQVITISHLPQIAAKGNQHYFVYKDNTAAQSVSKVKLLNKEERIIEIAKMIGGENASESARKSAEELLGN